MTDGPVAPASSPRRQRPSHRRVPLLLLQHNDSRPKHCVNQATCALHPAHPVSHQGVLHVMWQHAMLHSSAQHADCCHPSFLQSTGCPSCSPSSPRLLPRCASWPPGRQHCLVERHMIYGGPTCSSHLHSTHPCLPLFSAGRPQALLPVIRNDLNLTRVDVGNAGIAAVCGAVGAYCLASPPLPPSSLRMTLLDRSLLRPPSLPPPSFNPPLSHSLTHMTPCRPPPLLVVLPVMITRRRLFVCVCARAQPPVS